MTSTIPYFLSSNGLSRAKPHAAYPQVISRSFRDEDRSFKGVEANLSILRQRIEVIGSKEKLERCYKFQQQGWNYISEYNEKHKRDKLVLESFEVAGPLLKLNYYFLQNFLKDPMVLIAEFMYLKIPRTGIWAGMRTVRYFDGRTYEWVGISQQPNIIGKVKRTLGQFTPAHWDKDEWHPLLGPWRFLQVLSLCVVFLTVHSSSSFVFGPMESLVCSRTRRVEDDEPVAAHRQAGVIPSLFAASVWCSNDDVNPYPYPLVLALPVPNHHHQEEISVCSTTTTVEYHPQAAVNPPLSAASVWCFNDDVQESPLLLALPVPNHHDQEEIRKLSVCSTTTTVEYHQQAAVKPPLSAASVWCFNDDIQESPHLLALPRSNLHHQEEITPLLTLFTRSEVDHPTAAPTIEDHLPIKKRKRSVITAPSKPQNNPIQVGHPNTLSAPTIKDHLPINNHHRSDNLGNLAELIGAASSFSLSLFPPTKNPKKPIKNDHHWDDELIDAASSLSLSLPTTMKRKRLPKPKKPENSSIQEKEEEGVIIAKRQKKKVVDKNPPTGALENHHHHHWIHKRLSTSDVNLSSRLLLPKEELIKYVLPLMDMESCRACQNRDGLRVKIWDLETESEHELSLKQWVTGSFLLTSNWNKEFVKRRSLHEGDTISMCWDFENLRFLFRKFNA
nr:CDP-diacylglycerol--serine O-phosphatidyltransferase 1-like isoform X1 [Ipomoea batatas]